MDAKFIYKWLGVFGLGICLVSLIELIFFILLNSIININIEGQFYTIGIIVFTSGFMPPHSILIGIVIFSSIIIYIALGAVLYLVSLKKSMEDAILAKFILLIGLFLILGGFFKLTFTVFLGKTTITAGATSMTFHEAIYDQHMTPLFGAVIWMYLIAVVCSLLISGLIFGAVGLKWILKLQESSSNSK